jgi:putative transposase
VKPPQVVTDPVIYFVTPAERHAGEDHALLAKRVVIYEAAKERHPERWSGSTRNWQRINIVHLNPEKKIDEKELQTEQKNAA